MNPEERKALKNLVDYLWYDEEKGYLESLDEGVGVADNHIFLSLRTLQAFLNKDTCCYLPGKCPHSPQCS